MTKADFTFTNIAMALVIGYCVFMSPLWIKLISEMFFEK